MANTATFQQANFGAIADTMLTTFRAEKWELTLPTHAFEILEIPHETVSSMSPDISAQELSSSDIITLDNLAEECDRMPETEQNSREQERLEQLLEQKFQEGYAAGYAEGGMQGQNHAAQIACVVPAVKVQSLLESMTQHLHALVETHAHRQFDAFKRMALGLAAELAKVEIQTNAKAIDSLVRHCLEALDADAQRITIELHPNDRMLLQQQEKPDEWQHFDWVEDQNLQPGSVRIRTEHAAVEDLFQNRIASLMQELLSQSEGDSHV